MAGLGDRLRAAFAHHQAGRFDAAEAGYRTVLKAQPNATEALYLYGMLALQQGRADTAQQRLTRALATAKDDPRILIGLARALDRDGKTAAARPYYQRAVTADPENAVAWRGLVSAALDAGDVDDALEAAQAGLAAHAGDGRLLVLLGLARHRAGDLGGAEEALRDAVRSAPDDGDGWLNLAALLHETDRTEDALRLAERAVECAPGDPSAHANLAAILLALGSLDEAEAACRRALAMLPEHRDAAVNLVAALERQGKHEAAAETARAALGEHPDDPGLTLNLGLSLMALGKGEEAEATLRRAGELNPEAGRPLEALGALLQRTGRPAASEQASRAAIERAGDSARLCTNLSVALLAQGRHGEALDAARRAVRADPKNAEARSHLASIFNYAAVDGESPAAAANEAQRWAEIHESPLRDSWVAHTNDPNPDRRLRVGYLSPDLRAHSVAFFLEPILATHDRAVVETVCYADVVVEDPVSGRLRDLSGGWRPVSAMTPAETAALIVQDGIDVLVDLAGHTWPRGLQVMAHRPAPVQASWIGYPATTGLAGIDIRLTDSVADPASDTDAGYSEGLVRLDPPFLAYRPPDDAPAPLRAEGPPTFGSFNNPAKIAAPVMIVWAQLLESVPEARLLLKYPGLDEAAFAESLRARFADAGLPPDRLELRGRSADMANHLGAYGDVDVALDTFPYNGTTTTCEALWMGVPVVSLAGMAHAGRVGASLLRSMGLGDWVAADPTDYVARAAALMGARAQHAANRATLREQMRTAPLCDGRRAAAEAERVFREAWRRWVAGR